MKNPDAYRMRERHEEMKKREKVKHPLTGEAIGLGAHDRSLNQIFSDRRETNLFFLYLNKKNSTMARGVIEKRVKEPADILSEGEERFLEENREPFNVLRAETDLMRSLVNEDQLRRIQHSDKDLNELVGQTDPSWAAGFLADQMEELAIEDEPRFSRLVGSLKAADEIQGGKLTERHERRVNTLLQKYGVSKEQYEEATVPGLSGESSEKLRELVYRQMPGWQKALEWVNFGTVARWRAGRLYNAYANREMHLRDADEHLSAIVKVLRGTVNREEIRRLYQNRGFAEGPTESTRHTVVSIQDLRKLRKEFALETDRVEKDFKRFRKPEAKKLGQNKNWHDNGTGNLSDTEKNNIKDKFKEAEKKRREKESAMGIMKVAMDELFNASYEQELETKLADMVANNR